MEWYTWIGAVLEINGDDVGSRHGSAGGGHLVGNGDRLSGRQGIGRASNGIDVPDIADGVVSECLGRFIQSDGCRAWNIDEAVVGKCVGDREEASILRGAGIGDGHSEGGLIALVHLIWSDNSLSPGDDWDKKQQQCDPTPHPLHSACLLAVCTHHRLPDFSTSTSRKP